MSFYYLASPYSSPDPEVMNKRYLQVMRHLSWRLSKRLWTYSPIVHCHEMSKAFGLPKDAIFWQDYNEIMIIASRGIVVLELEGWRESKGISMEIAFAHRKGVPVDYEELQP